MTPAHLGGTGQLNLVTRYGPLDILCRLHDGRDHDALLARSHEIFDGELRVRVIDLDALIEIKAATGRVRDQLVLPILIALRDRRPGQ